MVRYAEPLAVNHGEVCCTSGRESRCAMLNQWLCIIVNFAELVVVKHGEIYRDIGCESL